VSDLDKLIHAAEKQQRERTTAAGSRTLQGGTKQTRKQSIRGWIAAGVVMAALFWVLGRSLLPISEEIVRADLNDALDTAQSAVEAYHTDNDTLPERVPLAALSQLVTLEPTGGGCRLSLFMNGMMLSRDVVLPTGDETD
jgi:hypothetical protein